MPSGDSARHSPFHGRPPAGPTPTPFHPPPFPRAAIRIGLKNVWTTIERMRGVIAWAYGLSLPCAEDVESFGDNASTSYFRIIIIQYQMITRRRPEFQIFDIVQAGRNEVAWSTEEKY